MVEVIVDYQEDLHCKAQHGPSRTVIATDAPVDNQGKGEAFAPTDLVATALGTCMATIMGIVARRENTDLAGLRICVRKEMSTDLPRRITRLEVDCQMPIFESDSLSEVLKKAAMGCPVFHSLHPSIEVVLNWEWR